MFNWLWRKLKAKPKTEPTQDLSDWTIQPVSVLPLGSFPVIDTAKFEIALAFVLRNEGGFVNHPLDTGGPTNFGITLAQYERFLGRYVNADDVKHMPISHAKMIYQNKYWDDHMSQLPQNVATVIFDWSVLHGTSHARELAQLVANSMGASPQLRLDGELGLRSIAAINNLIPRIFVKRYVEHVRRWMVNADSTFKAGWLARADRMEALA